MMYLSKYVHLTHLRTLKKPRGQEKCPQLQLTTNQLSAHVSLSKISWYIVQLRPSDNTYVHQAFQPESFTK